MVTQQYIKSRKAYKLTFEVPAAELPEVEVESLAVVGSFNEWDNSAHVMKANAQGNYLILVEVDEPKSYQYRYQLNGDTWLNDWHAEYYLPNEFGSDNCVITVEQAA